MKVKISAVNGYVPPGVVSSAEVEHMVNDFQHFLDHGTIERLFGVRNRRYATEGIQVSDLAVAAALPLLTQVDKEDIDCMIFAAACSDLAEPATANIVQSKLGLKCPVFDIKNACNSFTTAIHTASAFILAGMYKKVLVTNGEILHHAIKYNVASKTDLCNRLAAFSLGDAGAAAILEPSTDESGIYYQKFITIGDHWDLCTILGSGSMYPHNGEMNYFTGKTSDLKDIFMEQSNDLFQGFIYQSDWKITDIKHVFMHQVSKGSFEAVSKKTGLPLHLFYSVLGEYGNTAAASIPLAMADAQEKGLLNKGDKILVLGLAAGISLSAQFMIW